jgi:acyl homoserine lactone synthase
MIDCVTIANAHLFGNALASMYRLRYKVFIRQEQWRVPTWRDMEYDQYDTPAAHYLVWRDNRGEVRGMSRLSPTDRPYMLKDIWPDMVTVGDLPASPLVWEGTRFAVDADLPVALRRRVIAELVAGYAEFGLAMGLEHFIGIMPPAVWRVVFRANGWAPEFLGQPYLIDGNRILPGRIAVTPEAAEAVRRATGLNGPVLRLFDDVAAAA